MKFLAFGLICLGYFFGLHKQSIEMVDFTFIYYTTVAYFFIVSKFDVAFSSRHPVLVTYRNPMESVSRVLSYTHLVSEMSHVMFLPNNYMEFQVMFLSRATRPKCHSVGRSVGLYVPLLIFRHFRA